MHTQTVSYQTGMLLGGCQLSVTVWKLSLFLLPHLKMSIKLECTPALKVANVPLFSTDYGKFLVIDHPNPSSATVNLKPAPWFTYWV